jgi:hypothetical protein
VFDSCRCVHDSRWAAVYKGELAAGSPDELVASAVVSRTRPEGRRRPSFSALALLLFVGVTAALWIVGRGAPYTYDAPASYLIYLEGYNAATFPGLNPLLGDTAASPDAAAHPAYAAQSPDLFARLISQAFIRANIGDVRAQEAFAIALTAAALLFAVRVLNRMAGTAIAATTIALFAMHYIGFLSWTFSLAVALDFLLFWANLYLLQRYLDRPTRLRLAAAAAGVVAISLHDPTLGAFVVLIELFCVWQLRIPVRNRLSLSVAIGLAAGLTLAAWAALLSVLLGPAVASITWSQSVGDPQSIGAAYRAMFGLGHGAVILVIYPLLVLEIVGLAWPRLRSLDLSVPLAISVAIVASLWLDRSTALIGDWEPVGSVPIVYIGLWVALAALLLIIALRLAKARPVIHPSNGASARVEVVTTRVFIVAVGLAAVVLTLSPIGDFVPRFIARYQPSLVFVEDLILATVLVALVRRIHWRSPRSFESAVALVGVVALGSYWLAYQGKLALRYPPTEVSLASTLRGNASLAGASFVAAPDLVPVVWYYTRGRAQSAEATSATPVRADFLVCATECPEQSTLPLQAWAYTINPPGGLIQTPHFQVYELPVCETPDAPVACAPWSLADAPPVLDPIGGESSAHVALAVTQTDTGEVAHVSYTATPSAGSPRVDAVVRLYALRTDGGWCPLGEITGRTDFPLPNLSSGRLRAAVIPRSSTYGAGLEYLSDPVDIRVKRVITLPDIKSGGVQQVVAESLQEAEQKALAAGTWNQAAGTYGNVSVAVLNRYPAAETLCRQ